MPDNTSFNANVGGGSVGVASAQEVRIGSQTFISNFYNATPQAEIAKPAGPIPPCPYPGLAFFGPSDAPRFFGREQAIQALVATVAKRSFTALVGASGSGKSSVVLAGLAPRLETEGGWRATYFRIATEPDKNPFAALARALSPMLGGDVIDHLARTEKLTAGLILGEITLPNIVAQCCTASLGKRILLISDQFEEVFTLVPDEALRNRFIDALIAAFPDPAQGSTPDVSLVLTLRADFVSEAINYRKLADKLKDRVEYLGPMTREELRDAIVKPAQAMGVGFGEGLVDTILDDVEKRPGSLPLLQFALREMWGRLKTRLMTRADYDAIDGVEGALAKRAQEIFDDATQEGKDQPQAALFRRLFTRLVTLGEGAEATRRIVGRKELGPEEWTLAQKLAGENNRLIVTASTVSGLETAEVVHEALIPGWPTLVGWVQGDRALLLWRNRLRPRMEDWRANPTDEGTLLRGGPLAAAEKWIDARGDEFNDDERAFVKASVTATRAVQQRERNNREQEQARLAETQTKTTLSQLRTRFGLIFIVVWTAATGAQALSYFYNNSDPIISTTEYFTIIAIRGLSAPCVILLTLLPRYLLLTSWFEKRSIWFVNYFCLILAYLIGFILFNVPKNSAYQLSNIVFSLQYPLYAISIGTLIDLRVSRAHNLPPRGRFYDAAILSIVAAAGNFCQMLILRYFSTLFADAFLQNVIAAGLLYLFIGFVLGVYIPKSAATALLEARRICDHWSNQPHDALSLPDEILEKSA